MPQIALRRKIQRDCSMHRTKTSTSGVIVYDDVIKWKHFPCYWPFVWGIHRSLVNSPHKSQWRDVLMFWLICVWINDWVNNREAGHLRRHRAHYDVIIMFSWKLTFTRFLLYQYICRCTIFCIVCRCFCIIYSCILYSKVACIFLNNCSRCWNAGVMLHISVKCSHGFK